MKKFKFKLESVLKNCKFKEEGMKIKLSEKEKIYQTEKMKLQKLVGELSNTLIKMGKEKQKMSNIGIINLCERYIEEVKKKIREGKFILDKLMKELDETRLQLLEIIKNRKVMERLKEKEWQKYKITILTLEQKNFDEIARIQFNRKSMSCEDRA